MWINSLHTLLHERFEATERWRPQAHEACFLCTQVIEGKGSGLVQRVRYPREVAEEGP